MDLQQQLALFCEQAACDGRLHPTHVSLYLALLRQWARYPDRLVFPIARKELMAVSRISSRVTYHRRMRELHAYGYIDYIPTYNYYRGSAVQLLRGPERRHALEAGFNRM